MGNLPRVCSRVAQAAVSYTHLDVYKRQEEGAALKLTVSGESPGWTRQLGTPTTDVLSAMATDSVGNVYVGMYTTGALDGKPNAGIFDGYLLKYRPTGALEFATPIATTGSDVINAIAIDAQDNICLLYTSRCV